MPHMDEADRQAIVREAFYGSAILNKIDWGGNANTFTSQLIDVCVKFGEIEVGATYTDSTIK